MAKSSCLCRAAGRTAAKSEATTTRAASGSWITIARSDCLKQYILAYYSQKNLPLFSLVADVSKAHRRFLHAPEERGLLACRVRETDQEVYINKVGTFGVASASYWWGRIAGAGLRLCHELLGREHPVELLLFADDLEALGNGQHGRRGIVLTFLYLAAMGFPFKG